MKKNLLLRLTAVATTLLHFASCAQIAQTHHSKPITLFQKKISWPVVSNLKVATVEIDVRTRQAFEKNYAESNDVTWFKTSKGFVVAMYWKNDITTNVVYKKQGRWICTDKRYTDEYILPKYVRAMIKSTYYDYRILQIQELTVPEIDGIIYQVLVQDEQKQKTLRVYNGAMDVIYEIVRDGF